MNLMPQFYARQYIAALALLSLGLAGCAGPSYVSVDRKVFHTLPAAATLRGKKFTLVFADLNQKRSLEFQAHAERVSEYLTNQGLVRANEEVAADYTVEILFSISGNEKVVSSSSPVFASTGGTANYSATTFSGGVAATTFGTVTAQPGIQQVGSRTSVSSYTEYSRVFVLKIYQTKGYKPGESLPIYEGVAMSEGTSRDTPKLFPILMSSLLYDFPSKSGVMDHDLRYSLGE